MNTISSSKEAATILHPFFKGLDHEEIWILIVKGKEPVTSMKICSEAYIKENHIRHLRNSVCHGNVKIQLDNNPLQSQIVFVDKRRNGTETARYSMNSEQLANVIEMILSEILLAFLNQIGWRIGSGE